MKKRFVCLGSYCDKIAVRPCLIPTNLPRAQDPPEHDTQPFSTTAHTAEQPQTPDEEARDILAKATETRRRMDPAHGGQQFEHTSICMPWFVNTAHSSRRFMRPRKNRPHAAKVPRMHPDTGLDKNSLRSHHNSRRTATLRPVAAGQNHNGRLFFADESVRHPINPQAEVLYNPLRCRTPYRDASD